MKIRILEYNENIVYFLYFTWFFLLETEDILGSEPHGPMSIYFLHKI